MKGDKREGGQTDECDRAEVGDEGGEKRQIDSRTGEIEYMPEEKMIKADCGQVGGGGSCRRE